ncbi:MAG TPA: glycosyltransferase [Planctomycetota bacterium]|nr:glycosyltransferase [Planctomycetota bacterium]
MTALDGVFLALIAPGALFYLLGTLLLALQRLRPRAPIATDVPITVLKPLAGNRPGLERALESFLTQTHPTVQIIFGVASEDDPAHGVASTLIQKHPGRDAVIVLGGAPLGPNRKATNLHYMMARAKHDLLLVSDDDVIADPDLLSRLAGDMADPAVGLVTTSYWVRPTGLALALQGLTMATEFFPGVAIAQVMGGGLSFALGAASLVRRKLLEDLGGFQSLVDYLADDFLLGRRGRQKGWKIRLSRERVELTEHYEALGSYLRHQARWSRTYRVCQPVGYFSSILNHGLSWAALYLAATGASPRSRMMAGALLGFRMLSAAIQVSLTRPGLLWAWIWLVPFRDLLSTALWAASFLGNRVEWRGRRYRVRRGGRLEALP